MWPSVVALLGSSLHFKPVGLCSICEVDMSWQSLWLTFCIFLQVVIIVVSVVLPGIAGGGGNRNPGDAYSILQYLQACLWAAMLLSNCFLERQHNILSCNGCIHFYQASKRMRKANICIFSSGRTSYMHRTVSAPIWHWGKLRCTIHYGLLTQEWVQ